MSTSRSKTGNLDTIASGYLEKPAIREVVSPDPAFCVHWSTHGYPDPVARWNFHPEYEVHLIQATTGRYIIGNEIGTFTPGHLVLVGPNVPHDWVSDVQDGHIDERDVVLHFHGEWFSQCAQVMPELAELDGLLTRAARGIEFLGRTAEQGARELVRIGQCNGAARIQHIFGLLDILNNAPAHEHRFIMQGWVPEVDDSEAVDVVNTAIEYIFANIAGTVRLSTAAGLAKMSQSAFSRYFKAASGHTFTNMVQQLRLTEARRLLETTAKPIGVIAQEVGYANLSNFNRQFLAHHRRTPREYRRARENRI